MSDPGRDPNLVRDIIVHRESNNLLKEIGELERKIVGLELEILESTKKSNPVIEYPQLTQPH